jgi:hypothetical protein
MRGRWLSLARTRSVRAAIALAWLSAAGAASGEAPARVVSINLCTDQLAMLVAAPGQLVSVSRLAADPRASNLADGAAKLPLNSGAAEQVFLLSVITVSRPCSRLMATMWLVWARCCLKCRSKVFRHFGRPM